MLINVAYLCFVLSIGPRYMKNRPAYNLRTLILFYNFMQILINLWLTKEYISAGWFSKYGFRCTVKDSNSPNAIKIFNITWFTLLLKIFDYVETCIFVLRKKQNQVSTLHVYHHISTVMFTWSFLKYILDERATLICLINCSVHVLMYTYYFVAAWGPKYRKMISPIKPYMTQIQMIQFAVLMLYILQALLPSCKDIPNIFPFFVVNLLIILYLFYDFYKKTYKNKKDKQKSN